MSHYVWNAKTMKDVDCVKNMVNVPKIFLGAMIAKNINQPLTNKKLSAIIIIADFFELLQNMQQADDKP